MLKKYYQPPDNTLWQGRLDTPADSAFFQLIQYLDLNTPPEPALKQNAFVFLGFCSEEGIRRNAGRLGAYQGPIALREAIAKLPIHTKGIALFDAGNILCLDEDLEGAQSALAQTVALLLRQGFIPIVLGGGHELAFGHYQGIAKTASTPRLDIVNCDAHLDMRPLLANGRGSSGTPFLQIAQALETAGKPFFYHCLGIQRSANTAALFATAEKYQVDILLAEHIQQNPPTFTQAFVKKILKQTETLYLSLCLDVLASAFAPGVSAPQACGLTPMQLLPIVRQFAASGKVLSYDIAELSPALDQDARTAKLAAQLIFEIIHHHQFKGN